MKILRTIFIVIAVIAAVLVVVGFFLPKTAHVERSVTINASPDTVFQQVNTFDDYNEWSPWHERDPDARYLFTGPDSGKGAMMSWESDDPQVGDGSQEIIESTYPKLVKTELFFGEDPKPGYATFQLEELGPRRTKLTWTFDADFGNNIIGRYFGIFMDDMLGPDYEKGLQNLKQMIEN